MGISTKILYNQFLHTEIYFGDTSGSRVYSRKYTTWQGIGEITPSIVKNNAIIGKSLVFDGINTRIIMVGNPFIGYPSNSDFTVNIRFKSNQSGLIYSSTGQGQGLLFALTNGSLQCYNKTTLINMTTSQILLPIINGMMYSILINIRQIL